MGTISFARGAPAPECLAVDLLAECAKSAIERDGTAVLSYGTGLGYAPLREWLSERYSIDPSQILLTNGSLQGFVYLAQHFFWSGVGGRVLVEAPSYDRPLLILRHHGVEVSTIEMDDEGLDPEALERELKRGPKPAFLYTIPTFQNPSGRTLSVERRKRIVELAQEYDLLVLEDDPYGCLRYAGTSVAPIKALDTEGIVIYLSTISKTIAPGLRVGWLVASEPIRRKLTIVKQAADLHTSSLDQRIVYRYLTDFDNDAHIRQIRKSYGERHAIMDATLTESMPAGFSWTKPEGGMFLWVTCPEGVDTNELMREALARKVLFVPGQDFFSNDPGQRYMRLNFSNASAEQIRVGIKRLAEVCAAALQCAIA